MYIISKWRDYYDNVRSFGVDKIVVYNRRQERLEDKPNWNEKSTIAGRLSDQIEHLPYGHGGVVGFCGNIYPYIQLSFSPKLNTSPYEYRYEHYYDAESFLKRISELKIDLNQRSSSRYYFSRKRRQDKEQEIHKFYQQDFSFAKAWFSKYQIVSFVAGAYNNTVKDEIETPVYPFNSSWALINPKLADLEFWKVEPTAQAFQKIYQFISGVIGVAENSTVVISDVDMQAKKGFTHQYSFRKEPSKLKD